MNPREPEVRFEDVSWLRLAIYSNASDTEWQSLNTPILVRFVQLNLLLVAVVILAGIVAFTVPASLHADDSAAPIFVTKIVPGYRGAVLGNDVAIKAYREGKLPFPDGTIVAALHYSHVPSAENNKVFGQAQSFVPGPATNIQLVVKDSTKYVATGGWGFATFINGKPDAPASMKSCFPCHNQAKASDLVFTRYAP